MQYVFGIYFYNEMDAYQTRDRLMRSSMAHGKQMNIKHSTHFDRPSYECRRQQKPT